MHVDGVQIGCLLLFAFWRPEIARLKVSIGTSRAHRRDHWPVAFLFLDGFRNELSELEKESRRELITT
jgi:hypothetical protein